MDRKTKWRKLTALGSVHLAGGWVRKPAAETLQPQIDAAVADAAVDVVKATD
jgi:hypothetical protein